MAKKKQLTDKEYVDRELGRILFQLEELMTDFECAEGGMRTWSEFADELNRLHESITEVQDKVVDGLLEIPNGMATGRAKWEKHVKELQQKARAAKAGK